MTIKELSQLYWLDKEVEELKQRAAEIEQRAASPSSPNISGMPKGSSPTASKVESSAVECADMYAKIAALQEKCEIERARLMDYIDRIPDSFMRLVFRARFLDYKSWEKVAKAMSGKYTGSSIRKMVMRYLESTP